MSNDNLLPNKVGYTFIVDSFEDVVDPNDGVTTLREVINAANSLTGEDTVAFNVISGSEIKLSEQLNISDDLIINGPGAGNLTISGDGTFNNLSIDNANVVINGLTIANGRDGIDVGSNSTVTVTNSAFVNNTDDGLQISGDGNTVTVSGTTFSANVGDGIDVNGAGSKH
jgi:hypothetical protein